MSSEPNRPAEIGPENPRPVKDNRQMRGERRIITALFCDVVNSTGLVETIFGDWLEEHAHRLAQHFALAGDFERAVRYFTMAGEVAEALHAREESAAHFGQALEAARQLGDSAAVARLQAKAPSGQGFAAQS